MLGSCISHFTGLLLILFVAEGNHASLIEGDSFFDKEVTEVTYGKEIGGMYSKQISENGDSLLIGSIPVETKGDSSTSVVCTKNLDVKDYKPKYKTEIYKRGSNSYKMTEKETKERVDVSKYFVHTRKDLWSCSSQTAPNELSFLRVVHHLYGMIEIRGIKYYDGIDVTTKHYLGTQKTAKIREVKYLVNNETGTFVIRYLGKLKEIEPEGNDHGVAYLVKVHLFRNPITEYKKPFSEMKTTQNGEKIVIGNGIKLAVQYKYNESLAIGDDDTKAACYEETGIHPFPSQYRMQIEQLVTYYGKEFPAEIENYNDYYTPFHQEIWICAGEKNGVEFQFVRVVNEIIGRRPFESLRIHEGVTEVFEIKLNDNSVTIRAREVRYFDAFTQEEIKYLGKVALIDMSQRPPTYPVEVSYVLDDNRLFKLLISSTGYNIRVGQRWQKEIAKEVGGVAIECQLDSSIKYSRSYQTRFRLKARSQDESARFIYSLESLDKDTKHRFIRHLTQEVSLCAPSNNPLMKRFLRVFNEMTLLEPINEVEFLDGIYVFDEFLSTESRTVRIVEIKYLDLTEKKVIKYAGEVRMKKNKFGSPSVLTTDVQPMKVTKDDVFWRVGHFSDLNVDFLDFNSYMKLHDKYKGEMELKGEGEYKLFFAVALKKWIGTAQDVAECIKAKSDKTLGCTFLHKFDTKKRKEVMSRELGAYLRQDDVIDKWICHLPNGEKFTYLSTKRVLKALSELISPYKDNIYLVKWIPSKYAEVNFKMIDDKSYLSANLVNFFNHSTFINYDGKLLFDGGEGTGKLSGTVPLEDKEEKITKRLNYLTEEINYDVGRDWFYTSVLNKTATLSLHIGRKWERVFGNPSTVIHCQKDNDVDMGMFEAFFRTRVRKDNHDVTAKRPPNQHLFEEHFEVSKQEVWNCETVKGSNKIIRVLNHFYIKKHKCDVIKQLFYYDGVTILLGPSPIEDQGTCTEIVEVKYFDEYYSTLLKFEGKVLLKGENGEALSNEITARKLKQVAKLEVNYLPEKQVHKTSIGDRGLVVEIGVANEETIEVTRLVCTENTGYLPAHRNKYIPVIKMNKLTDVSTSKIEQEILSIEEYHKWFTVTQTMMDCKEPGQDRVYTRVVNTLEAKHDCEKIATILHYDGVEIDKEPVLRIREIKFYKDKECTKTIRIVGFVHLEEKTLSQGSQTIQPTTEIYYKLDAERLNVKPISTGAIQYRVGPIIEVGSPFQATFGKREDTVLCTRERNHSFDKKYKMRILSNLRGTNDIESELELDDETVRKYFEVMKQELWYCEKNRREAFLRVVNVYVVLKDVSRTYYPDGVTIGIQIFPDNSQAVQVREIKYLRPTDLIPLKYEGKLTLESLSSNKATSLFQKPSEYTEYEIETMDRLAVKAESIKYWPLDVLRLHAMRSNPTNEKLPAIRYNPKTTKKTNRQHRNIELIEGARGVKIEIGSKYEKTLETSNEMKCLLDEWNPTNEKKFLTRIKLLYDNDVFELDADTILEYFDIISIEVWICVNHNNTMLRVETSLKGVKEIYMAVKYPGIKTETINLSNGRKSISITEVKYMDPKDFKIVKYKGELQMIKRVTTARDIAIEEESSPGVVAKVVSTVLKPIERSSLVSYVLSFFKNK